MRKSMGLKVNQLAKGREVALKQWNWNMDWKPVLTSILQSQAPKANVIH